MPQTVADISREIDVINTIEILIIDDGSTDRTIDVAREIGVDHIIVNRDWDNRCAGSDVPKLIQPILDGATDVIFCSPAVGDFTAWASHEPLRTGIVDN